jgi:hypothetical protein
MHGSARSLSSSLGVVDVVKKQSRATASDFTTIIHNSLLHSTLKECNAPFHNSPSAFCATA